MKTKKSIVNSFLTIIIVIFCIPLVILGSIAILWRYSDFHKESMQLRKEYIEAQEIIVKHEVEKAVEYIEYRKATAKVSEKELQKEVLEWFSRIRFQNRGNEAGILYVRSYEGIHLMTVSTPELIGKDISKMTDPDGINTHDLFMKTVKNPEGGFAEYSWYNPVVKKVGRKRSFVKGIPEWQWYIGAGFWFDDINSVIEQKRLEMKVAIKGYVVVIFLIMIILFILVYTDLRYLSKKIKKNFDDFSSFCKKAATGSAKIDLKNMHFSECEELASSANSMIVERERAEEALRLYSHIVSSVNELLSYVDCNYIYLAVNDAYCHYHNKKAEDMVGESVTDLHGPDTFNNNIKPQLDRVLQGERISYDAWFDYAGRGRRFMAVEYSPYLGDTGEISGVVVLAADITERKQAEEALHESELRLRHLAAQLISAQEEERKHISLELHDEMGQVLTAVGINLESIGKELPPEHAAMIKDKLTETISLVEQASDHVRDLSLDLRPYMLDDLGLLPTLRWYVNNYKKRTGVPVKFEAVTRGERLAPDLETVLYRVVQESLNNVVKHARAKKVKIRLEHKKKKVHISIKDDGVGFNPDQIMSETTSVKGLGLLGMRERVSLLGGNFSIRSSEGQGTTIFAELPIH